MKKIKSETNHWPLNCMTNPSNSFHNLSAVCSELSAVADAICRREGIREKEERYTGHAGGAGVMMPAAARASLEHREEGAKSHASGSAGEHSQCPVLPVAIVTLPDHDTTYPRRHSSI